MPHDSLIPRTTPLSLRLRSCLAAMFLVPSLLLTSAPASALTTKKWVGVGSAPLVTGTDFNAAANWSPSGTPGPGDSCVIITVPSAVNTDALITLSTDITVGALAAIDSATARVLRVDATTRKLTILGTLIGEAHGAAATTQTQFTVGVASVSGGTIEVLGDATFGVNGLQQTFLRGITTSTNSQFIFRGNVTFGINGVTSGSNFPSKYVFDAPGTQTITVNPPADQPLLETVGLSAVDIGGTNSPTVILAGSGEPFLSSAATYNLTVKVNSTLDLRAHTLNRTASGATFFLGPGARLLLGGRTGGQTGSNFPLNYATNSLDAMSTVEYNAGGGVNQTIFAVAAPGYGHLRLSNGSATGTTAKTATAALTVRGDLTIGSGATFAAGTSLTHNVGGNWTNDGSFSFTTGNTINFNTAGSRTIGGGSNSGFDKIALNKGSDATNVLEVTSPISMTAATTTPTLTLTNGTFKLSSPSTITPFGGATVTIGPSAGYFLNHPGATSNWGSTAGALGVNGKLTLASGTLNVNGRLQATSATSSVAVTGGTLAIPAGGTISTATNSIFEVGSAATFSMTGGTVLVASPNANTALPDVNINQSGAPITGGSFLITTGGSPKTITVGSNVPFFDLRVQNGATAVTAQPRSTLRVANDLTITSGTLDAATNNANIEVGHNWSNGGTFVPGTATVTCNGSAPQTIGGTAATTFNHLTVNNGAGVGLGASATVAGTLTLTAGTFSIAANTLTIQDALAGTPTNLSAGPASSLTVAGSGAGIPLPTSVSQLNNFTANRAGTSSAMLGTDLTVGGVLGLTDGAVVTGSSTLALGTMGAVSRTNGYVIGNLKKHVSAGAGTSLSYEVGSASGYSPIDIVFGNVSGAGELTASTTPTDHPSIAGSGLDEPKTVNRYYTLTNSGTTFDQYGATVNFVAGDLDPGADPSKFVVWKFDSPTWTMATVGARTATSTQATGLTSFSDFAIGEPIVFTINASAGANGTISPSGAVRVNYGSNQTFDLTPDPGYNVEDVLVDAISVGAVTSYAFINVTGPHTIAASFAVTAFTITATAGPHGSISPSGVVPVDFGGSKTFTITPDPGYHVARLMVDDDLLAPASSYTFTNIMANHTISASFDVNPDALTVTTVGQGTVSRNPDLPSYEDGAIVELTATAAAGWAFSGWSGDTTSTVNPLGVVMNGNKSVVATFTDATAPLAAVVSPNGGESLDVGATAGLLWTASDNVGVTAVDLLLSRTGVAGPFESIAADLANSGSYTWTVTGPVSSDAFLKVVAHDAAGHLGEDLSDAAFSIAATTGVEGGAVTEFALGRVWPNPLHGSCRIGFAVPREAQVRLGILDVQGRELVRLADRLYQPGRYQIAWDGRTDRGSVAAGLYFVRLQVPGHRFVRRIVVAH